MTQLGIVNHGANRFEVQGDGKRIAVFDKFADAKKFVAADELAEVLRTGEVDHYLDLFTQYAFNHQEIDLDDYEQRMKAVWDLRAAQRQYREATDG